MSRQWCVIGDSARAALNEIGDKTKSHDYDPTALQFITRIRDALGPDCHKLMIDELPDYIRSIAEKAKANE